MSFTETWYIVVFYLKKKKKFSSNESRYPGNILLGLLHLRRLYFTIISAEFFLLIENSELITLVFPPFKNVALSRGIQTSYEKFIAIKTVVFWYEYFFLCFQASSSFFISSVLIMIDLGVDFLICFLVGVCSTFESSLWVLSNLEGFPNTISSILSAYYFLSSSENFMP